MVLVFEEVRPPKVWWLADFSKLSVNGQTLELKKYQDVLQKIYKFSTEKLNLLTGGQPLSSNVKNVRNNLSDESWGYSWLSHSLYSDSRLSLLKILFSQLGTLLAVKNSTGGSVATAKADVFSNNCLFRLDKLTKISRIFDEISKAKSRGVT